MRSQLSWTRFVVYFSSLFFLMGLLFLPQQGWSGETTHLFPVIVNDKVGYIDSTGKMKIKPQFYPEFYMNHLGETFMISFNRFFEGLAVVSINPLRGAINEKGTFVIPPRYHDIANSSEGRLIARKFVRTAPESQKPILIGHQGKIFIPSDGFDRIYSFHEGLAIAGQHIHQSYNGPGTSDSRFGYIDRNGKVKISPQFDWALDFSEGLAAVGTARAPADPTWAFINKQGRQVIDGPFDRVGKFSDGLAPVNINGKGWGFINPRGDYIILPQFRAAKEFSEGMAAVNVQGKWGYIDRNGKIKISPHFDSADRFFEGLALVGLGSKSGFIDHGGNFVIPPQFDSACHFLNGLALVSISTSLTNFGRDHHTVLAYIDRSGRFIWKKVLPLDLALSDWSCCGY